MNNKKQIEFLLYKWKQITPLASMHRTILENIKYEQANNLPTQQIPKQIIQIRPIQRLNLIKKRIIEIMPELEWIKKDFNLNIELSNEALIELYTSHQKITIDKIREIISCANNEDIQ